MIRGTEWSQPTLPSICSSIRRIHSTAYSIALVLVFFSSRRRHTIFDCDWSSDVCSSDLPSRAGSMQGESPWAMQPFADRLAVAVEKKRSQLVVGLDPLLERLPPELAGEEGTGEGWVGRKGRFRGWPARLKKKIRLCVIPA